MDARNLVKGLSEIDIADLLSAIGYKYCDEHDFELSSIILKASDVVQVRFVASMPDLSPVEEGFVIGGSKIEAIKSYKNRYPEYGLVESKLKVDMFGNTVNR